MEQDKNMLRSFYVLQSVTLEKGHGSSALQSKECSICYVPVRFRHLVTFDITLSVAIKLKT